MTAPPGRLPAVAGPSPDRLPAVNKASPEQHNRSQLGNGAIYDQRVDGRRAGARRFREVLETYHEALDRDATGVEQILLRSAASLQLVIDDWEAEGIRGDHSHYDEWKSALSQRDKMLRRVGILAGPGHYPAIMTAGAQADEDDDL